MESACEGCFFVMILAHLYRFFGTDVLSSQHRRRAEKRRIQRKLSAGIEVEELNEDALASLQSTEIVSTGEFDDYTELLAEFES